MLILHGYSILKSYSENVSNLSPTLFAKHMLRIVQEASSHQPSTHVMAQ